jgi:hypothetical protein
MTLWRIDPRSAGFAWTDRSAAGARLLSPADVDRFNRDGAVALQGAVDRGRFAALVAQLDVLEAELEGTRITLEGETAYDYPRDTIIFVKNPILRAPAVRELLTGALFRGLAHDLVGAPARLYWDQAVYKKPGRGPAFPWHQDNAYTFTEPLAYLTCWIALTDASVEDGCPWIIPGAHRRGVYAHGRGSWGLEIEGVDALLTEHPPLALPVAAGDMVAFSSLTPHMTGPNNTDRVRKALIAQYIANGARVLDQSGTAQAVDDPARNPILS